MTSELNLLAIRKRLDLTQEQMARMIGVSFVSVNRWEGGHSSPVAAIQDLYAAIAAALRAGTSPAAIRKAAENERGIFLFTLFKMAYGSKKRGS